MNEEDDFQIDGEVEEILDFEADNQKSRQLKIRRAIEDRLEEKRMREEFGLG